jgi:hypothetical protein
MVTRRRFGRDIGLPEPHCLRLGTGTNALAFQCALRQPTKADTYSRQGRRCK